MAASYTGAPWVSVPESVLWDGLRDVRRQCQEVLGVLIHVIGGDAANPPSRALPSLPLTRVLADVKVERPTVDLDDQAYRRPAEVGFLAGDVHVQPWK